MAKSSSDEKIKGMYVKIGGDTSGVYCRHEIP